MVTDLLKIHQASLPSVRLGVPLFLGYARHAHFSKILGSIRRKLAGWKTNCLSFVGRLTLVKHILCSTPLHISLVTSLPSKTCSQIERLLRNFLWSADSIKSRSNFVRWEKICLPKSEGGLGLRRMKDLNEACLLKLAWSVSTESSLWANWLSASYCRGKSI